MSQLYYDENTMLKDTIRRLVIEYADETGIGRANVMAEIMRLLERLEDK